MNIAFIGYRTSGKTTISTQLAKLLDWNHLEIDREIEELFDMPIPGLVKEFGWKTFRMVEKNIIKQYCNVEKLILDLGGGAVIDRENMLHIRKNAFVIFLDCSIKTICQRIKQSYYRPPLTDLGLEEEIKTILKERLPLYRQYADFIMHTDSHSIEQCLNLILKRLQQYHWFKTLYPIQKRS